VLIAEDHDDVRRLAADILRTCGYDVMEAADGLDGIEIVEMAGAQSICF
jgi:CheY-like chemotaxis protein